MHGKMIFTIGIHRKMIFYDRNALGNDFNNKNALQMIFTVRMH